MATDQALLESVDVTGQPVLRFYVWQSPTISLGYFQRVADCAEHVESSGLDCVRRSTGGGAIIHHHELTYSLAVPIDGTTAGPRLDLYRQTHQCLVQTLREHGVRAAPYRMLAHSQSAGDGDPFLCFQRRTAEDLIVNGYKVVGSAQRKSRSSMLQHGSVLLRSSQWAPQLPGIEDLTSQAVSIEVLADSFAQQLGLALSVDWQRDQLSEFEHQRAKEVVQRTFGNERWLNRR